MEQELIIHLQDATIFQKKIPVLSGVSLDIYQGEFVYLIGRTGTGKSSLLKTLYGDLRLTQGDGKIAGYDLKKIKEKDIPFLRRKLGIVFQDFQLLTDRTVRENLLFVLRATGWKDRHKTEERIQQVLDKVNLGTKGYKMPHELSGGEQQRVAIARSLLNDPVVILADEPTGNLDPDTSYEIMNLLFEISDSGRAVLMATHNYSIIDKFPSRIIKCDQGKIMDTAIPA